MKQDIQQLDKNFQSATNEGELNWIDIRDFGVEGRAYDDTKSFYDRFPARAEGVVRDPVWNLSLHSAGMSVRFVTNATTLSARWTLRFESLQMSHMPSSGVSGLDLYIRDRELNQWRWIGAGIPEKYPDNEVAILTPERAPAEEDEFMLYLPLYNGVESVKIGFPADAAVKPAPAYEGAKAKPILFYGTSILHGGCASRPGLAYPSIIGRKLDWPIYNFGFSGNGQIEPETADLLAELDPAAYLIDPLPNNEANGVRERMPTFVRKLHAAHPQTPIVLVENITYQAAKYIPARRERYTQSNQALREVFSELVTSGVTNLRLLSGERLLGEDCEGTVDGTHPNDLGFMRMAEAIEPILREVLA